jgi:hypothetical protein
MTNIIKHTSFSAPKISYFTKAETKKTIFYSTSQETSPSLYCILNFPLSDSVQTNQKNFFFDNSIPLTELQLLGETSPLEPINQKFQESCEKAKSECKNFKLPARLSFYKTKSKEKPRVFTFCNPIDEVDEDIKKNKLEIKLDLPCVKLQPPPLDKFRKRKERCTRQNETISNEVINGVIDRYNLKNRFGRIKTSEKKFVLYEDDLVVSGVNLRHFKNAVKKKENIKVEFKIKQFEDNGAEKIRPCEIRIILT